MVFAWYKLCILCYRNTKFVSQLKIEHIFFIHIFIYLLFKYSCVLVDINFVYFAIVTQSSITKIEYIYLFIYLFIYCLNRHYFYIYIFVYLLSKYSGVLSDKNCAIVTQSSITIKGWIYFFIYIFIYCLIHSFISIQP